MDTIRLKIRKHDDKHIALQALGGIDHFGFGTFLCDLKPEEVECDEFSARSLIGATERSGLNGLEIWADNRLAWGDPSEAIIMPISEISKMPGADKWLSEITTEEVRDETKRNP